MPFAAGIHDPLIPNDLLRYIRRPSWSLSLAKDFIYLFIHVYLCPNVAQMNALLRENSTKCLFCCVFSRKSLVGEYIGGGVESASS